jgi:hypothetical protein
VPRLQDFVSSRLLYLRLFYSVPKEDFNISWCGFQFGIARKRSATGKVLNSGAAGTETE